MFEKRLLLVHCLPVFNSEGDYQWKCIYTVYSKIKGFILEPGEWSRVRVWGGGLPPETTPKAEKSNLEEVSKSKIEI